MKDCSDTLNLLNTIIRPIEIDPDPICLFRVVNHVKGVTFGNLLDFQVRLAIAHRLLSLRRRRPRDGECDSEQQDRETASGTSHCLTPLLPQNDIHDLTHPAGVEY